MERPVVKICASCQHEYPAVDQQVTAHMKDIMFSHGYCPRHSLEFYAGIPNTTPEDLAAKKVKIDAVASRMAPDLSQRPDLVKAYSQGIFTQEQLAQHVTERLQKLANIIKS